MLDPSKFGCNAVQGSRTCRATKQVSYGRESAVTVISKTSRLLTLAIVLGNCQGKVFHLHAFWSSSVASSAGGLITLFPKFGSTAGRDAGPTDQAEARLRHWTFEVEY